jgi:hypothetical protein
MEAIMPQSTALPSQRPHDNQSTGSIGNKPVDKFRDGPVHVSIWENKGPKGAFRTASFELRYKDNQEQWQTGKNYSSSSLLHLESSAREARARIEGWQQAHPKAAPRS